MRLRSSSARLQQRSTTKPQTSTTSSLTIEQLLIILHKSGWQHKDNWFTAFVKTNQARTPEISSNFTKRNLVSRILCKGTICRRQRQYGNVIATPSSKGRMSKASWASSTSRRELLMASTLKLTILWTPPKTFDLSQSSALTGRKRWLVISKRMTIGECTEILPPSWRL